MADHNATITYTDDGSNNGNGSFSVDSDPIIMTGPGNIFFTLALGNNTSGWAWAVSPSNAFGIDGDPTESPFSFTVMQNGKIKVTDNNNATANTPYNYYVQIQKGSTVRRYDPVIDNDPPQIMFVRSKVAAGSGSPLGFSKK